MSEQVGPDGRLIGLDVDATALRQHPLDHYSNTTLVNSNFADLTDTLRSLEIENVAGILADLGWRTEQFLTPPGQTGKGFSFREDEPLLMTLGDPAAYSFTAADIVNDWDEEVLANIIYGYGEERQARRIAAHIIDARAKTPISSSLQLAEIVAGAIPKRFHNPRVHPATKTFQAIRIAVNDELGVLERFLLAASQVLDHDGRLAIITFHSLEDRLVKHTFRAWADREIGTVITKKPITPTKEEIAANPRARSAKLRIFAHY
jgi:16S rRNA (cytosine1402-N4)-methyltransferase